MLSRARRRVVLNLRHLSTSVRNRTEDEGDWLYSSEWWDGKGTDGQTVFQSFSDKGNGQVSVIAYPSSKPEKVYWERTEKWLQQRYGDLHPGYKHEGNFKILGYQWRALRFNDDTRQSTVKVMAAYRKSEPGSLFLMQQAHCLAIPYVKSMISAGLATISSCNYDLHKAIHGAKTMNILCIGHGGGSIPLFLASKIQGAVVHDVEIDPTVISASVKAMGFPSSSVVVTPSGNGTSTFDPIEEVLWKGTRERILLYESDAEKFINETTSLYDIVFIDAYDGDDVFPYKLWDPHFPFLKALGDRLHPEHGTVVVNLHSDVDYSAGGFNPAGEHFLPMGRYVKQVCGAYKEALLGNGDSRNGLAYVVSVPWVCNTSLVVARGFSKGDDGSLNREMVLNRLACRSFEVENDLELPFSCLQYIKRGFILVD
nr:uncharacterized protein LOC109175681 [Ipomoea batatas]